MRAPMFPPECRHLLVRPWFDPTVDEIGHDPRSPYVERFWLGTLGPPTSQIAPIPGAGDDQSQSAGGKSGQVSVIPVTEEDTPPVTIGDAARRK